jgi:hypothetical protein
VSFAFATLAVAWLLTVAVFVRLDPEFRCSDLPALKPELRIAVTAASLMVGIAMFISANQRGGNP